MIKHGGNKNVWNDNDVYHHRNWRSWIGLTYVGCDTDCAVLKWIGYAIGTLAIPAIILIANFASIGV